MQAYIVGEPLEFLCCMSGSFRSFYFIYSSKVISLLLIRYLNNLS